MPEVYRVSVSFPVIPSTGGAVYAGAGTTLGVTAAGTSGQVLTSQGVAAPIWATPSAVTPAALTRVDDTNVTLTLGGTPSTALLQATSITAGWAGQLSLSRGGTNANMTPVNGGALYSTATALAVTAAGTTGQVLTSQGASAPVWSTPTDTRTTAIALLIDGNGSAITTGVKGFIQVPFSCTITGWTILSTDAAATSGSIEIDVWKDTFGNYPPTVLDTITASAKPTLTTASAATSTTLTGWTTAIASGAILGFNVDSITDVTRILLELNVTRT